MPQLDVETARRKAWEHANLCVRELRGELDEETQKKLIVRLMDLFATHFLSPKAIGSVQEVSELAGVFEPPKTLEATDVAQMLAEAKCILRGHFELLSGLHTHYFFRFGNLARSCDRIADDIVARLAGKARPEAILVPTSAGAMLGSVLGRELGASVVYADVNERGRPVGIRPGSRAPHGTRVLIVNDMITTGGGVKHLVDIALAQSWDIAGVAVFAVRGEHPDEILREATTGIGYDVYATAKLRLPAYPKDRCSLCQQKVPLYRSANLNR